MIDETPVRDAATLILIRRDGGSAKVLMGQRGSAAAFMPDKFVFPGGGLDPDDLAFSEDGSVEGALPYAAIRELWEETGLVLARSSDAAPVADAPAGWRGFFAAGHRPDPAQLRLIFRAVTPPSRPRRFDARFFLAESTDLIGSPDDFSGASGELSFLQWVDLATARALALPFITEVVLGEVEAMLAEPDLPRRIPFFQQSAEGSHFRFL